ncbi:MAG: AbrB/MazE/SpoVT family DNA-binding domain-containing protein [Chitinophagaceae bacterium]|jgi:AbrB family looped-hinge helix DNA binding protein|nr:AbrB/MazE/SpoVT family DNA-binding domain-containing protein [Chitinophagaceae bacterium]
METSVPTSKGQVLIPKRLREKYGIEPGVRVLFEETKHGLLIKSMNRDYFNKFRGLLRNDDNLDEEIKKYKAEEIKQEEQKLSLSKK